MAISPLHYLIMPRVLAMTLACIALTFYFQLIAVGGGWIVTSLRLDIELGSQIAKFFEIISFKEISVSIFKSMVFGILVSVISCYHGLRKKTAFTEIPQAISQAVIRSLMAVFIADGVITMMAF